MGTIPIRASSSYLQESFESNHAFCIAFNAFFESNRADGVDLNAFNEWSAKSTKYIHSLKQEYKKETLNIHDVKTVTLRILTRFINDDNINCNGTDIELMIIKLLSLCHFLNIEPPEERDEEFLFSRFVFHVLATIILSRDALQQIESKYQFAINIYFGSEIKTNLTRKCIAVNIDKLQNKSYILIKKELMPFMHHIEGICMVIADFVQYKYFKVIQKMTILFIHCVNWMNFGKMSNIHWMHRVRPQTNRYNLANIIGATSYALSLEFEMEKVNAYSIMFVYKYKLNKYKLCKPRDAVHGLNLFLTRFSKTSSVGINPRQFIDLVSHFCNGNWRIMHGFLSYWMSIDSKTPARIFITDNRRKLDFIFNEILIKYKVLENANSALALLIFFHGNLGSITRSYHDDDGKICNNIFQIVYPKYITDDIINLAKQCHRFAESKAGFRRYSSEITRLPQFTAIDLFHQYMGKLTLFT